MFAGLRNRTGKRGGGGAKARQPVFAEPLDERLLMYHAYGDDAKWTFANQSISYSYANMFDGGMTGITNGQIVNGVEEAMGIWSAVIPLKFFELPDSGPLLGDNGSTMADYDPIGHPYLRWSHHFIDGAAGTTLAHALRPGDRGQHGDIHFDDGETWRVAPPAGGNTWDFLETAAHEFGHAIGLDHEDGVPSLMNSINGNIYTGLGTAFLFADDVAGIQSVYGPGLGYVINSLGALHVYGTGGDDIMTVNYAGGSLVVTSEVAGTGMVRSFGRAIDDGQTTITSIHLHGQNGNDILRVENNNGLPTWVNGNDGNDTCDVEFVTRNLAFARGPVTFFSGPGSDRAFVYDDNSTAAHATYTVFGDRVLRAPIGNSEFNFTHDSEEVTLVTGKGADAVSVPATAPGRRLFLRSGGGDDTVEVGSLSAGLRGVEGAVEVQNTPAHSALNITDAANPSAGRMQVNDDGNFTSLTGVPARISWKNSDVSGVTFTSGKARDTIEILSVGKPLTLGSSGGDDDVLVGAFGRGLAGINGTLTVGASGQVGLLGLLDQFDAAARVATVNRVGAFDEVIGLAPALIRYANADTVSYALGPGNDVLRFNSPTPAAKSLTVIGGDGNDGVILNGCLTPAVEVVGESGLDGLVLDDRTLAANVDMFLYPDRVVRAEAPTPEDPGRAFSVRYSVDSLDYYEPAGQNYMEVYGTSPGIPAGQATRVWGNDTNNIVSVFTRDVAGNPTIASDLGILLGGDADTVNVIDNGTVGTTFELTNRGAATTGNIFGVGVNGAGLGVYYDVESLNVYGGGGNDTFKLQSYQSGNALQIYGRGGNDTVEFAPDRHNVTVTLTAMSYFGYDGGAGYNRLSVYNENNAASFDYTVDPGALAIRRKPPAPNYFFLAHLIDVQVGAIYAGPNADRLVVNATSPNFMPVFNGGGGDDQLVAGAAPGGGGAGMAAVAAAGLTLDGIVGGLQFWGGDGSDSVHLDDSGDITGDVVHVDDYFVGGDADDSLFGTDPTGVKGWLRYEAESVALELGSGDDRLFVKPLEASSLFVDAGGGANNLSVDLTGVTDPQFTPGVFQNTGVYTSADRQPLRVVGFESRVDVVRAGSVSARHVFYNNSAFDGRDPAAGGSDDAAIAPGKVPVVTAGNPPPLAQPGSAAVTSYTRGLNGVIIDVAGLAPLGDGNLPGPDDFVFRAGTAADLSTWAYAPAPTGITVRRGEGDGGSDRVTIVWPDGALVNTWLEVTVLADLDTGLAAPDVFYFGNLVGETNDPTGATRVTAADLLATRAAASGRRAAIEDPHDHDRDGFVNVRDLRAVLSNLGRSLTPPALPETPPVEMPAVTFAPSPIRSRAPSRRSLLSSPGDAVVH